MSEGCTDCGIGIEPTVPEDKVSEADIPKTKIEEVSASIVPEKVDQKAELETNEKLPENAEVSGMLGLLTASCLLSEDDKREECWKGIEPLESSKEQPLDTVKRIIELEGADKIEKTMEALEALITEAKKELENK